MCTPSSLIILYSALLLCSPTIFYPLSHNCNVFWQSKVHLHSHKDYTCICYLCPCQLANISARLAEKERREKKMMNNLAFHKCILAVLKVATNMGEHLYSQISLKVCESEEKPVETTSETPYCTISHVFHQSWHSSKLICKRSSSQCSAHSGQEWSGSPITLNITTTSL